MKSIEQRKIDIRKSLQSIIQGPTPENRFAFRSIRVPEELLTEEMKEKDYKLLGLAGNECRSYDKIIRELREIPFLEYLSDEEISKKVDHLLCELYFSGKKYKDKKAIENRVAVFFNDVIKPFSTYEIYVGVSNLELTQQSVHLGDITLFTPTNEFKKEIKEGIEYGGLYNEFKKSFQVIAKTEEPGNNFIEAKKRARLKILEHLSFAKIAVQKRKYLHEDRIEFELSELTIIKELIEPPNYLWSWAKAESADQIHFGDEEQVARFMELCQGAKTLDQKFQAKLKMALHWINSAYAEADYEIKQIFLCTALESILSSKGDAKKGAKLALRIFTLATCFGGTFLPADRFYVIYEDRSDLVHGSEINTSAKANYTSLLLETQNSIRYMLAICKEHSIKSQREVISYIEGCESWKKVIAYLRKFPNKVTENILKEVGLPLQSE